VYETKPAEEAAMDELAREHEARSAKAMELMAADPRLPYISALVIAGDLMSADRSLQWLREGKHPFGRADVFCGSYGRLDFRVRAYEEGLVTFDEVTEDWADAWSGSDPDDTDPRFLSMWQLAFAANGDKYLRDSEGKALPRGPVLHVYRGQDEGAEFGIAWSLDPLIAKKFAKGAATRQHGRNGVVYAARVYRADILGYMTGRSEREVIVNPSHLHDVEVWL